MRTPLLSEVRTWWPADRAEEQLREVAFEVPDGVTALSVDLSFEPGPDRVIDLGLCGPDEVRGWSGGARRHVMVSAGWSTPGYHAAPVTSGRWAVLLGLHRVPDGGLAVTLSVRAASRSEVDAEVDAEIHAETARLPSKTSVGERPPARDLPGFGGLRWRPGDFHSHTVHSDGALSVTGLAELAARRGLEFLAVTDHNTTSHHRELPDAAARQGILLIPGQELTRDTGHANALGDIGFIDFRARPETWSATVTSRGGLLSINHPLAADCAWLHDAGPELSGTRLAEVWHSSWALVPTWGAPLAWWQAWDPTAIPLGGSDFHHHGADGLPGAPTTWVLADGDDVLGAVAAGRTAVSADRDGPLLLRHGDELLALGADGLLLTGFDRPRRPLVGDRITIPVVGGPWWLEDGRRRVHALTP